MWYHISNRQNSNSMDLCVVPLNIFVILLYFWTCMFCVLQKPWWWHIQRYNIYTYMSLWSSNLKDLWQIRTISMTLFITGIYEPLTFHDCICWTVFHSCSKELKWFIKEKKIRAPYKIYRTTTDDLHLVLLNGLKEKKVIW